MPPDEPAVIVNEAPAPEATQAAAAAEVAHAEARVAEAEAHADAAVAIAEAEAAASVQREEIAAEAAVEIATAVTREELETCQRNLETISTTQLSILARLEAMEPRLNPIPASAGTLREDGSRTMEPSGQSPAAQSPVLAAEHQNPPEPPKKKSGVRWT